MLVCVILNMLLCGVGVGCACVSPFSDFPNVCMDNGLPAYLLASLSCVEDSNP